MMNRYQIIKEEALHLLEEKSHGFYKRRTLSHMFQVETICAILAKKRQLNVELAAICGLLHDLSIGIDCNDFAHASRSSILAKQLMEDTNQFTTEEVKIVTQAIAHHSDKSEINDDYSELIKDSDVLAHELEGEILKPAEQERLIKISKELMLT